MHHDDEGHISLKHYAVLKGLSPPESKRPTLARPDIEVVLPGHPYDLMTPTGSSAAEVPHDIAVTISSR